MAKILFRNSWFEELASAGIYEATLEGIVRAKAAIIWPPFHFVIFKSTVTDGEAVAKPDLALIEKTYREWWVVEVEMEHHSFEEHVLPQVKTLSRAKYGQDQVMHLCRSCQDLEEGKLNDMMKGKQPRVLVIVNKPKPDWAKSLAKFDAALAVLEIFRNDKDEYLFRINGEHPVVLAEVITRCRIDPVIPRWLIIDSPGGLGILPNARISIIYDEHLTEWQRVDVSDRVWLQSLGPNPLFDNHDYEICRSGDGRLLFRDTPKKHMR